MTRFGVSAIGLALVLTGGVTLADSLPGGVQTRKADSGTTVLADSKGMTLYTFDIDKTPGKSACNPDTKCSTYWPPFAAAANAKDVGSWTAVTRDDGSKQWAYKGKPLYTFAADKKAGDTNGNDVGPNGTHIWHIAPP